MGVKSGKFSTNRKGYPEKLRLLQHFEIY